MSPTARKALKVLDHAATTVAGAAAGYLVAHLGGHITPVHLVEGAATAAAVALARSLPSTVVSDVQLAEPILLDMADAIVPTVEPIVSDVEQTLNTALTPAATTS